VRLLLAARLSQNHDGQTGIETQDQDARAWAERNGHTIVAVAADKKSGKYAMHERPNLRPWVTEPGKMALYDGIVAARQDRLSRARWRDESDIRRWAEDHGKQLFIVTPELHWPPANMAEQITWDVLAAQAHQEWVNTSMRYRRMHQYLRENDALVGRPPFGYRIVGQAKSKTLELDLVEAEALREAVRMYMEDGVSMRGLARHLNEAGFVTRNGGAWQVKTVSHLFRNPTLMGRRVDASGRTILRVPPVLDRATWDRLQAALDSRAYRKPATDSTALLTGVAVCAKCGGPMYRLNGGNTRKDGTRVPIWYYRCSGTTKVPSRCRNMFPLEELEARLDRFMTVAMARWPRFEIVVTPGHGHEDDIRAIEDDIRDLDLDDPEYAAKHQALVDERKRLKNLPSVRASADLRRTGDTVGKHWATLKTRAERRAFLLEIGMTIPVLRAKTRDEDVVGPFEITGWKRANLLSGIWDDDEYGLDDEELDEGLRQIGLVPIEPDGDPTTTA
jgi:site-specific DNA recombinase